MALIENRTTAGTVDLLKEFHLDSRGEKKFWIDGTIGTGDSVTIKAKHTESGDGSSVDIVTVTQPGHVILTLKPVYGLEVTFVNASTNLDVSIGECF